MLKQREDNEVVLCDGKPLDHCISYSITAGIAKVYKVDDEGNMAMTADGIRAEVEVVRGFISVSDKGAATSDLEKPKAAKNTKGQLKADLGPSGE